MIRESEPRSKLTITNVSTAERIDALYNPAEWNLQFQVNYNRLTPPGSSYEVLQYGNTANTTMRLSLYYLVKDEDDLSKRIADEKFLTAFLYPRRGAGTIQQHPPPRMFIVWPNGPAMKFVLINMTIRATRFNVFGDAIEETIDLELNEYRERNFFSEDALEQGLRRPQW